MLNGGESQTLILCPVEFLNVRRRTTCNSTIADANAIQIRLSRLPQPHRDAVQGIVSCAIRHGRVPRSESAPDLWYVEYQL